MKEQKKNELSREERNLIASIKYRMRKEPFAEYKIQQLATEAGINRTKLHKGFFFMFGVHINVYLLEQRLILAKKILTRTNLPIKAVATKSGFRNEKYFFRFFKRRTTYTPLSYRNRTKDK